MKKIISFLAGVCLGLNAYGQGYWAPMIEGAPGDFPNVTAVYNALLCHDGVVYGGGNLAEAFGPDANNIYAFDGTGYMLGTNVTGLNTDGLIWTICADGPGNIYAAGATSGTDPGFDVMKWNGSNWTVLGAETPLNANDFIFSLCADAADRIYAAGNFRNGVGAGAKHYVARWDGNTWSELGGFSALGANAAILSIVTDAAGNLYAAGRFTNASGKRYVARWNGVVWSELGGPNALGANDYIEKIYVDGAGNIYAAGRFTNAEGYRYVAKWDSSTWSELGTGVNTLNANGVIKAITSDAAGNIYAAGLFTNGSGAFYVAQWDGSNTWAELGAGPYALDANSGILTLCVDAEERVYAAGNFSNSGLGVYVARYADNFDVYRVQVKVLNNLPPQISTSGGTLQMTSKVFPVMGNQNVTWNIASAALATISATGKITALANGDVWAKATSVENPALADSMMVTLSGQVSTGIDELIKAGAFQLFPNPAKDELVFELAPEYSNGRLNIYDVKGASVLSQAIKGNKSRLNIRSFAAGVYTLHYRSGSHKLTTTFTKR